MLATPFIPRRRRRHRLPQYAIRAARHANAKAVGMAPGQLGPAIAVDRSIAGEVASGQIHYSKARPHRAARISRDAVGNLIVDEFAVRNTHDRTGRVARPFGVGSR